MPTRPPELRRTWIFGPDDQGLSSLVVDSNADVVIIDLERYTPASLRDAAKEMFPSCMEASRHLNRVAGFRIRHLGVGGDLDLEVAMASHPEIIALAKSESVEQVIELDGAISTWEDRLAVDAGATELVLLIATPLGLANLKSMAAASNRIKAAILDRGDFTKDLSGSQPDGPRPDHTRRRFLLECREAKIEPVDKSTVIYADRDDAVEDARRALRLGFRSKVIGHFLQAAEVNAVFTPAQTALTQAKHVVSRFVRASADDNVDNSGYEYVDILEYKWAQNLLDRGKRLQEIEWD